MMDGPVLVLVFVFACEILLVVATWASSVVICDSPLFDSRSSSVDVTMLSSVPILDEFLALFARGPWVTRPVF